MTILINSRYELDEIHKVFFKILSGKLGKRFLLKSKIALILRKTLTFIFLNNIFKLPSFFKSTNASCTSRLIFISSTSTILFA